MHVRRAMLLFAIVLGLAALASSISRPRNEPGEPAGGRTTTEQRPKAVPPATATREPARLRFSTTERRRRQRLATGRPAVVMVQVDRPGLVELDGLGLIAPADPQTPARFDVLTDQPAVARVRVTAAGSSVAELVGTLVISAPEPARSGAPHARSTGPDR